jgi:hypothetical protein
MDTLLSFSYRIFNELKYFFLSGAQDKKGPKGISKSPWSLHIGSFWKIHFITTPKG